MKIIKFSYYHPVYQMPYVMIETGWWIFKKRTEYLCIYVSIFSSFWVDKDTKKEVNKYEKRELYNHLNAAGLAAQLLVKKGETEANGIYSIKY